MADIYALKEKFKDLCEVSNFVSETLQVNGYQQLQGAFARRLHALSEEIKLIED